MAMRVGRLFLMLAALGAFLMQAAAETDRPGSRPTPTPKAEEKDDGRSDEGTIKRLFRGIGKSDEAGDRDRDRGDDGKDGGDERPSPSKRRKDAADKESKKSERKAD